MMVAHPPQPRAPLEPKRVVILGAGLAGLSAAWVLARSGLPVTLLEKARTVGGLAVTLRRGPFEYDLGPHNIHSVHEHVLTFLHRHFAGSLFEHFPRSKILKRGKLIDYPLRGSKVLSSLPVWKLPSAGLSFLGARIGMFLGTPRSDASFEAWITNRFGRQLYDEYFGPYASKVWGIPPATIDKHVAEKRIPVVGLTELMRAALFGGAAGANHPEFTDHNYYLRHGIGETVDFFRTGAEGAGASIECGVAVERVSTSAGRVRSVSGSLADGTPFAMDAEYLLSTIPLNESPMLFDGAPAQVREAAKALDYCATVLLFFEVSRPSVLPTPMLYFSDPKLPFSRMYDVGMYSGEMVPAGKTMLCLEYPCSFGDHVWNATEAELARQAMESLSATGVLDPDDVEGFFAERISHSYPRFRIGFEARVRECFDYFARFDNFLSFGRQGGFAYQNIDDVIHFGFKAATAVMAAESMGHTCHEWFSSR